jgi:hypothetical protein
MNTSVQLDVTLARSCSADAKRNPRIAFSLDLANLFFNGSVVSFAVSGNGGDVRHSGR